MITMTSWKFEFFSGLKENLDFFKEHFKNTFLKNILPTKVKHHIIIQYEDLLCDFNINNINNISM